MALPARLMILTASLAVANIYSLLTHFKRAYFSINKLFWFYIQCRINFKETTKASPLNAPKS